MNQPKERWKIIPESNGWYEISDLGRVRSWYNNKWGRLQSPRIKKPSNNGVGYWWIKVSEQAPKMYIHRLVARAFLGDSDLQVNHINGNPSDNRLCNLEYVTHSVNMKHAVLVLGKNRGEQVASSKLTEQDVRSIKRRLATGEMQKHIAADFNVYQSTISDIATGRQWNWLNS